MIAQIIEFFKAAIFFSAVTFVQVNIISWLFAFPISVNSLKTILFVIGFTC